MTQGPWTTEQTLTWGLRGLADQHAAAGKPYLEFLRTPDLSAGLYILEVGGIDRQSPHTEDEIYVVMSGHGRLTMGDDDVAADPGCVLFVAAGVEHRFHDIMERLELLVAFGPAEESRQP